MLIRSIIFLLLVLPALPAFGQEPIPHTFGQEPIPQTFLEKLARDLAELQQASSRAAFAEASLGVRIVNNNSTVYAGAGKDTAPIATLEKGDQAPVIDNAGGWYAIQLPNETSGWVQARDVAPIMRKLPSDPFAQAGGDYGAETQVGWLEEQIRSLLERASDFRNSYQNNPYVIVRGFDVNVSVPPSLGISFEFKE
jgi:hypothetical protein